MKTETLQAEIESTLEMLRRQRIQFGAQFDKLIVATTTSVKLLNDQSKTLQGVGGNPEKVKSYLLRLSESVHKDVIDGLKDIETKLNDLLRELKDE